MDFKGLLDDETLARIDKDAGLQQALALMAASGPSLMPTNLGSILLQGNQARDESRQAGLKNAMQRQELLQQRQRQQQMKDIAGMFSPVNAQAALAGGGGPTVANAARMNQPMGPEQAQRALLAAIETGDPKIIEYARSLKETLMPGFKTQSVQELMVGEKLKKFAVGEDGTMRELGVAPEKLIQVDAGGQKLLVSENTGKEINKFAVTMDPAQKAQIGLGYANLNQRKQEFEFQKGMGKALPEGVMNAQGYADRMLNAEQILAKSKAPGTGSMLLRGVPGAGNLLGNLANSPEEQQYYQAAQDWIRAKLRKESGAAIGVDEMAQEYQTYFPQIGDTPEVIKQKELARNQATMGMIRSGGPTYQPNLLGIPENLQGNVGATGGWSIKPAGQ